MPTPRPSSRPAAHTTARWAVVGHAISMSGPTPKYKTTGRFREPGDCHELGFSCFRKALFRCWQEQSRPLESARLLFVALGQNCPSMGVDDIMRAASFEPRVLQRIIHVPAVVF